MAQTLGNKFVVAATPPRRTLSAGTTSQTGNRVFSEMQRVKEQRKHTPTTAPIKTIFSNRRTSGGAKSVSIGKSFWNFGKPSKKQ